MKDYYYILGVKSNSTEKEIKSAYRKLSLKFHPDKNEGDKFFEERFKEINEAYEILGDIQKRKKYDEGSQNKSEKEHSSSKQESPAPEIVFFRVNKSSIKKGEILEISWETKFANSIKILPFGILEASGTKKFKINGDDSFQCKILASNGDKVVSKEISITVTKIQPNPTAPIILTFESDKVIADEDGFIELTWQTTNATRVEIEGLGIVPLSGSAKFNTKLKVNFNRPVSLTARNEFGSVIKSIRIYKRETQPVAESNYSFLWILALALVIMIIVAGIKSEPKATTTIPDDTAYAVDTTVAVDTVAFAGTESTDSDNFTNSDSPQIDPVNSQIEGRTEKEAEFTNNGFKGLQKFITDNFEIPSHSKNISANGKIFVEFEITTTGDNEIKSIHNDLKFNKDISIENKKIYTEKCEVAVRLLFSKMPKWIPSEKDGQLIISKFTIPIHITGN